MPSSVLSSKVGPSPPVVMMNFGFRLIISWISFAISSTLSAMAVTRFVVIPRFVDCLDNHWAFVFGILPISSSFPTQIISISGVMSVTFAVGQLRRVINVFLYSAC